MDGFSFLFFLVNPSSDYPRDFRKVSLFEFRLCGFQVFMSGRSMQEIIYLQK